jgi:hypothetical protein
MTEFGVRNPVHLEWTEVHDYGGGSRSYVLTARSGADRLFIQASPEVLDGLTADLRLTQKMVDTLPESQLWRDTMVGRLPNEWIRLRDEYRDRTAALAGSMVARGIAEKAVNVSAARAALMATMVKEAMRRAGAPPELIQATGDHLRQLAEEAAGQ